MGQSDLPLAKAAEHVKAFERLGWAKQPKRGKGSHVILTRPGVRFQVCLTAHGEVKRTILAKALRGAGITEREYIEAFR